MLYDPINQTWRESLDYESAETVYEPYEQVDEVEHPITHQPWVRARQTLDPYTLPDNTIKQVITTRSISEVLVDSKRFIWKASGVPRLYDPSTEGAVPFHFIIGRDIVEYTYNGAFIVSLSKGVNDNLQEGEEEPEDLTQFNEYKGWRISEDIYQYKYYRLGLENWRYEFRRNGQTTNLQVFYRDTLNQTLNLPETNDYYYIYVAEEDGVTADSPTQWVTKPLNNSVALDLPSPNAEVNPPRAAYLKVSYKQLTSLTIRTWGREWNSPLAFIEYSLKGSYEHGWTVYPDGETPSIDDPQPYLNGRTLEYAFSEPTPPTGDVIVDTDLPINVL